MNIAILTNEYPPNVYGGAGVHVEYLTRELAALDGGRHHVQVLCFGKQRERSPNLSVTGVEPPVALPAQEPRHAKLFATLLQDLVMSGTLAERGRRALPHVVLAFCGLPRKGAAGHPARAYHALARAAPSLEGRTAGDGLSRVHLDRAHRL